MTDIPALCLPSLAPHTFLPAVYLVLVSGLGGWGSVQSLWRTESPWEGMSYRACTGCATGSACTPLCTLDHCCVSEANYLLLTGELSWKISKSFLVVWSLYEYVSIFLSGSKLATAEQRLHTEQPYSAKLNSLNVLRGSA